MKSIDDLYEELNNLPKGTIVSKRTKGTARYYLQWRENGKIISKYVRPSQKADLTKKILKRKEIEKQIKQLSHNLPQSVTSLSANARKLTGFMMSQDTKTAFFKNGLCVWLDEKLAPLYLRRTRNLESFLASRTIDSERRNSRILKKALGLYETNEALLSLYFYGASITDDYWFKPLGSAKTYQDIAFQADFLARTALKGTLELIPRHLSPSPQLSLGGSYEKCWKLIDNEWWIIKVGTEEERFSEFFVYLLGKAFNFKMAEYVLENDTIRSRNFAKGLNYEPAKALMDENDDYLDCFNTFYDLSPELGKQYLTIIWMDSLVNNVDRHTENFGLLLSRKERKIVSLAPNFDNNAALIARGYPSNISRQNDGLISFFARLLQQSMKAKELYRQMKLPLLTKELLHSLFLLCPFKVDEEKLTDYLLNGYNILKRLQK
ncbi:MAG: hypothetical protein LKJ88_05880 [Bacilli bacterium]|jgi:hypothetical protein|nr:hypothetical protein [Bacilli bacterium]